MAGENENFKKWFGASKVVNEDGSPKTVYHGSQSGIPSEFRGLDNPAENQSSADWLLFGPGVYFTEKMNYAQAAAAGSKKKLAAGLSEEHARKRIVKTISEQEAQYGGSVNDWAAQVASHIDSHGIGGIPDAYHVKGYGLEDMFEEAGESILHAHLAINKPFDADTDEFEGLSYKELVAKYGSKAKVQEVLKEAGYDGLTHLNNEMEELAGEEGAQRHWVAWEPSQIKDVRNQNPTSNPNIHMASGGEVPFGPGEPAAPGEQDRIKALLKPGELVVPTEDVAAMKSLITAAAPNWKPEWLSGAPSGNVPKVANAPSGVEIAQSLGDFDKWLGDSKVVDEEGNPKTVYHGTYGTFDKFDNDKSLDLGHHFGTAEQAAEFGDKRISAHLSIQNPVRFSADAGSSPKLVHEQILSSGIDDERLNIAFTDFSKATEGKGSRYSASIDRAYFAIAKQVIQERGHDGVVYPNEIEGNGGDSWIAFDASQIRKLESGGIDAPAPSDSLSGVLGTPSLSSSDAAEQHLATGGTVKGGPLVAPAPSGSIGSTLSQSGNVTELEPGGEGPRHPTELDPMPIIYDAPSSARLFPDSEYSSYDAEDDRPIDLSLSAHDGSDESQSVPQIAPANSSGMAMQPTTAGAMSGQTGRSPAAPGLGGARRKRIANAPKSPWLGLAQNLTRAGIHGVTDSLNLPAGMGGIIGEFAGDQLFGKSGDGRNRDSKGKFASAGGGGMSGMLGSLFGGENGGSGGGNDELTEAIHDLTEIIGKLIERLDKKDSEKIGPAGYVAAQNAKNAPAPNLASPAPGTGGTPGQDSSNQLWETAKFAIQMAKALA